MNLEWTSPESDGGSRISSYIVIYGSPATPRYLYFNKVVKRPATKCTLRENLSPGRTYQFAVAARNEAGRGEFSDYSSSFTVPGEVGEEA